MIYCETLKDFDWSYLNGEEKKEIDQAIFENIKRDSDGWSIKEIYELLPKASFGARVDKNSMLVHKTLQLRYDDEGFLIYDYRLMAHKNQFTPEQWRELEQITKSVSHSDKNEVEEAKVEKSLRDRFLFLVGVSKH